MNTDQDLINLKSAALKYLDVADDYGIKGDNRNQNINITYAEQSIARANQLSIQRYGKLYIMI